MSIHPRCRLIKFRTAGDSRGLSSITSKKIRAIIRSRIIAQIFTTFLFLTALAPIQAFGTEPANLDNAIKVALRNGRDVVSIEAKSSMGKRLSDWRDSLPVNTAFTVDGADYATAKLVYFPDGTRINIRADGKIVYRKTSNLLSPQMSATFGKDDAHIVVIGSLIAEIEKDNKETK